MLVIPRKLCIIGNTVNGILRILMASLVFVGLSSCRSPVSSPKFRADSIVTSADSIPLAPVSGTIQGEQFTLSSARYFVDRRPGYQHVDIKLSAGKSAKDCASPIPDDSTSVWLRRVGSEQIEADTIHIASGQREAWEVHYQAMHDGEWIGNGDADALIVLQQRAADQRLSGEISACFADVAKSCVLGTFVAEYCPISIDAPIRGVNLMEPPVAHNQVNPPSPEGGLAKTGSP